MCLTDSLYNLARKIFTLLVVSHAEKINFGIIIREVALYSWREQTLRLEVKEHQHMKEFETYMIVILFRLLRMAYRYFGSGEVGLFRLLGSLCVL